MFSCHTAKQDSRLDTPFFFLRQERGSSITKSQVKDSQDPETSGKEMQGQSNNAALRLPPQHAASCWAVFPSVNGKSLEEKGPGSLLTSPLHAAQGWRLEVFRVAGCFGKWLTNCYNTSLFDGSISLQPFLGPATAS